MKTRCPRCSTRYQVDAAVLDRAGGKARCYKCGLVFDAAFNAVDATLTDSTVSRLTSPSSPTPAAYESAVDTDTFDPDSTVDPDTFDPHETVDTDTIQYELDHPGSMISEEITLSSEPVADLRTPEPENTPLGTAADVGPLPFDIPGNLPQLEPTVADAQGRTAAGKAWSAGRRSLRILFWLLALTAIIQLVWLQRAALMQIPELRPLLGGLCQPPECKIPASGSDKPEYVVVSREIAPAAGHPGLLDVRINIRHLASQPLPLPGIWLGLYTTEETVIAARRFRPAEYRGSRDAVVAPGEVFDVNLRIEDPGDSVTGYKLEFF